MKIRFAFLLLVVGVVSGLSSCTNQSLNALVPCTINGVVQSVPVNPQRALDLLIVIDDSPSMRDEQAKLQEQVPRLVNLLLTGGAAEPEAVGEFPAIESLHVGIITPDMGYSATEPSNAEVGVNFNPTSACTRFGEVGRNGQMQVEGLSGTGPDRTPCEAVTPPADTFYLNFPEGNFTPEQFVSDVECVTGQDNGCGFEQQLESILASENNGANAGFSREDALLAVILITDEDDCSSTTPLVFDVEDRDQSLNELQGPFTSMEELQFNLRCYEHRSRLQAVERYVEGIAALKSDPSQIVFAAITGIPEDGALDRANFVTDSEQFDAILADSGMEERLPEGPEGDQQGTQLVPACTATDGSGSAAPGRRIVETMKGLADTNSGVGTVVQSICQEDYAPALNAIVDRIAAALRQLCLPRPLNRTSDDLVGCEVREVQPAGKTCAEAGRGREPEAVGVEDGREVCRVTQLPSNPSAGVPSGLGWFYDDFTAETEAACSFNVDRQRVSFTEGAAPETGARVRFECLQAASPPTEDIGWPCNSTSQDEGASDCNPREGTCREGELGNEAGERSCRDRILREARFCLPALPVLADEESNDELRQAEDPAKCEARILLERYDRESLELTCDAASNTCQLTCERDSQCPGGYACFDASGDGNSYCVNPTCTLN
jgi:hypothetical protein